VLKGPNKVVITQSAARRYFGHEDPLGKTLLRGSERIATEVSGLVQDPPHNSHIDFDMVLSGESWQYMNDVIWVNSNLFTYFRVQPDADLEKVKGTLNNLMERNAAADLEKFLGMSFKQFQEQGSDLGLFIQPMLDIHLKSDISEEISPNGNIQYLYIFSAIALFIILIACINFMNLSTARSANRAKEVGVRKTIGAFRSRLVIQFLAESMIYSFLSTVLALALLSVSLVPFNMLSGKALDLSIFFNPVFIIAIVLFTILVGLIAGSYPALYLTAFKPVDILKGKLKAGFRNSSLRNALVVFQFVISISLIFGSIVVYQQLEYVQNKNLGFDKENVINLLHTMALKKDAQAFKNELASHPEFKGASFASRLPPNVNWNSAFRKGGTDQDFLFAVYEVDPDHLVTMGYTLSQGRFFSRDFPTDTAAAILNETAYEQMGFESLEEASVISYRGDKPTQLKVVGVLRDFNFESLKNSVKPMAILLSKEPNHEMAIRLAPGKTEDQIKLLQSIWKKYAPGAAFQYSFLDQNFDAQFRAEQRMSNIILIFTLLAIFIACLGLFGLATYTAEQRAKEISIRKVMGATVQQVVVLLSKDFTVLVLIAFAIAAPLGWFAAQNWLEGFAFRINLNGWVVLLSGFLALLIAMITISFQAVKAAKENPVNAMRGE
ncbi:MAG: ABC transporter permease, partial [Bacteroidota bacterium]